ncbi:MAG: hypothetical protein M3348_01730, partial [Acidobacteriota bacterium]|nr:hypothetical protein [Acidobacteriota bacterium]
MKRTPAAALITAPLLNLSFYSAAWRVIAVTLVFAGFASAQNKTAELDLVIQDVTVVDVEARQV